MSLYSNKNPASYKYFFVGSLFSARDLNEISEAGWELAEEWDNLGGRLYLFRRRLHGSNG